MSLSINHCTVLLTGSSPLWDWLNTSRLSQADDIQQFRMELHEVYGGAGSSIRSTSWTAHAHRRKTFDVAVCCWFI